MTTFRSAQYSEDGDTYDDPNPTDALLKSPNTFTKSNTVTPTDLAFASTINLSMTVNNHYSVLLTGNATLANPSNPKNGIILNLLVVQDATGGRVLTFGDKFYFADGGTAPTQTTAANGVDLYVFQYWSRISAWVGIHHPDLKAIA